MESTNNQTPARSSEEQLKAKYGGKLYRVGITVPVDDGGCGSAGAPHPVPLHHRGQPDELPFIQSGQENPAGENL